MNMISSSEIVCKLIISSIILILTTSQKVIAVSYRHCVTLYGPDFSVLATPTDSEEETKFDDSTSLSPSSLYYIEKAKYFLLSNKNILGLKEEEGKVVEGNKQQQTQTPPVDAFLDTLKFLSHRETGPWTTIRFQQQFISVEEGDSYPIYDARIAITIDTQDEDKVKMFTGSYYEYNTTKLSQRQKLSKGEILEKIKSRCYDCCDTDDLKDYFMEIVAYDTDNKGDDKDDNNAVANLILAWRTEVRCNDQNGMEEILYDAYTGDILKEEDIGFFYYTDFNKNHGEKKKDTYSSEINNTTEEKQLMKNTNIATENPYLSIMRNSEDAVPGITVSGFGSVFDPDPISTSKQVYGTGGFIDNNDSDTDDLTDQLFNVTLEGITLRENGKYYLDGPFARIIDVDEPFDGDFSQFSDDFRYTRGHDSFEAVMCYYHVDKMMKYVKEELNITLKPYQYTGGVLCDPHGMGGQMNAYYQSGTHGGFISFGQGGVDAAEDGEIILNALGHGLFDWLTHNGVSKKDGIVEGFADYIAASYTRSLNLYSTNDEHPNYYRVAKWFSHNEFLPNGRVVNYDGVYPHDLNHFNNHRDGQIWSTCNMRLYELIGREKLDKAMLVGISSLDKRSTQLDAAHALVLAAISLNYSEEEINTMVTTYRECGYYDVTIDTCGDDILGQYEECEGNMIGTAQCEDVGCTASSESFGNTKFSPLSLLDNNITSPNCISEICKLDYSPCKADLTHHTSFKITIEVNTDDYSSETSWELIDPSGETIFENGILEDNSYYKDTRCFELKKGFYKFILNDKHGDGLIGDGYYSISIDDMELSAMLKNPLCEKKIVRRFCPSCRDRILFKFLLQIFKDDS